MFIKTVYCITIITILFLSGCASTSTSSNKTDSSNLAIGETTPSGSIAAPNNAKSNDSLSTQEKASIEREKQAKILFNEGVDLAQNQKYKESIIKFKQVIEFFSDNPLVWFNLGISQYSIGDINGAITSFTRVIDEVPSFTKALFYRARAWLEIGEVRNTKQDFLMLVKQEEKHKEAFFYLAIVSEVLNEYADACLYVKKAKDLGMEDIDKQVEDFCKETRDKSYSNIFELTEFSTDSTYGNEENPIKVGYGLDGGPDNQHHYLGLLRDELGNKITYTRLGSCCEYESEGSPMGYGFLDMYEVKYKNKKGELLTKRLYITFYNFEKPLIPVGFLSKDTYKEK